MLGGKDWGNKKKVLIVLAFELLTLLGVAIILIPGSSTDVKENFWIDLKKY